MKIDKELLKGTTAILILSLLEKQPMYGYEMIKFLKEKSDGTFNFKEGTLYPILHNLEVDGHLNSFWEGPEGSRKRKYYQLTTLGKRLLAQKKKEWEVFSISVNTVIGGELCPE